MARNPHPGHAGLAALGRPLIAGVVACVASSCHDEPLMVPPQEQQSGMRAAGAPPGPKPSVVLLRRRQGLLVPLACYDAAAQALRAGAACAALIPEGAEVRLSDAHLGRVRRAAQLHCQTTSGEAGHPTFALIDGPPADAAPKPGPPLALWSSGPRPKLELPPTPPEPLPLAPSEMVAIKDAARNLLPAPQSLLLGQVIVDNVWTVDLDADGVRERLNQIRLFDLRDRFALLTGVFVVFGKDALTLRPLRVQIIPTLERERLGREDHSHDATMLAALDLDHDGRREVWLQLLRPGQITDTVGRLTDSGLATFAELTCPALPAPPSPPAPPAAPTTTPSRSL